MLEQDRRSKGIPIGGQFSPTIHAESDLHIGPCSAEPTRAPIFSDDDLRAKTSFGRSVAQKQRDLDELQKSPWRNVLRVREAQRQLAKAAKNYELIQEIAADNEAWHQQHPDAPSWAHSETDNVYTLYKELRNFQVTAETTDTSPEAEAASDRLHHRQLDESDKARLVQYFHYHERHGCKDRTDPNSPYWAAQRDIDAAASKPLPISKPVTVWRGENYSSQSQSDPAERVLTVRRIRYLLGLKPGDPFAWDSCAATSLSLHTAASGNFSGDMAPEDFRHPDPDPDRSNQAISHSVLFELETNRGIYINKELATAASPNEDEILIPRHMQFEVVGHSQLSAYNRTKARPGTAFHVIKLKLAASI